MNHGPLRRNTCIPKANVIQSAVLNWGNKFEENTCSSVRQLFTYLRSSMTDRRRFNNCFNLHVHKEPAECIKIGGCSQGIQ